MTVQEPWPPVGSETYDASDGAFAYLHRQAEKRSAVALPDGMPAAIARLPRNPAGYPIPWFVAQDENPTDPDFRVMDGRKLALAIRERRCWTCGGLRIGPVATFVIGPMCAVNRTSAEPPSHRSCAEWSARACPFLANPKKRRREGNKDPRAEDPAGIMLPRNPGVVLLWTSGVWGTWQAGNGVLFDIGHPREVQWIAEGRPATRDEVAASIDSGLPVLAEMAEAEGREALIELGRRVDAARALLPAEAGR